jgi:hypothetical protein
MKGATYVEISNGKLNVVSGGTSHFPLLQVKVLCHLSATKYAVPSALFNISEKFPSATRLEIEFAFDGEVTTTGVLEKTVELGEWIGEMAEKALRIGFEFPCDVYFALTDKSFPYANRDGTMTALGKNGEWDCPAIVIMGSKGYLVHIGPTRS